ncbi:Rv2175c family DNA-binding protein [Jatrophihabitans telluris]|uniref:Rv2175c family DNA-binding protein n=1 Tax=Jatrophihabitans telluris TaxID=2038343 RepID=A0ABY4QUT9_9ACTN|nr:Rv2175c family DNA-binding protein [Jatrophihabitans telluris]UQX87220.1 Rv2175c family DNA-binding protein [Jatrophihabitans telluris]
MSDLPPDLIPLPEAAELLDVQITVVHQLLKDGKLVAVADAQGRRSVPRGLLVPGAGGGRNAAAVVKGLPGVITLLRDARYGDEDIVAWLYREDDSLPGTPAQALAENRGTEVKRRAQAAGF